MGAGIMFEVFLGVTLFTVVVLALVVVIQVARNLLVPSGSVTVDVNGRRRWRCRSAASCWAVLADAGIFVSSACGGGGTCAQCRVKVLSGGGDILAHRDVATSTNARCAKAIACRASCRSSSRW